MTNAELQIDFETKYNRLSGSSYLGISYEELDWYLNEAMLQKIYKALDRKSNKRQEDQYDTRSQLFDIEEVLTKIALPVNKITDNLGQSLLPPDFLHLTEVDASVNTACDFSDMTTTTKSVKYIVVPLPLVAVASWTFHMTITGISTPVFALANIQNNTGTIQLEENYVFVQRILQYVNSQSLVKVYYENYGEIYQKNSFIFVYSGTGSLTTSTNVVNGVTTNPAPVTQSSSQITYTPTTKLVSCRVEPNEIAGAIDKNPFMKSSKKSPVVFPFRGFLQIVINGFNVNLLTVTYIRKPKVIDYRISQSVELGSTPGQKYKICQDIVDLAVANAAVRLGTNNSQTLESKTI